MTSLDTGWVAHVELPQEVSSKGCFVVPLQNGGFANEYHVDIAKYLGDGQRSNTETLKIVLVKNVFILNIADCFITFKAKRIRKSYTGRLAHPDFSSLLVEIEPNSKDLDKLLEETGYVLIGCDPWNNYGGINDR